MSKAYDLVVVGAGPGGYVCGIRAAQLGLRTLVVDKQHLGGVCLNVGCIPSKALIHASKVFYKASHGQHLGIIANDIQVDFGAMISWKDGIVGNLTSGVGKLLKANGADVRMGSARLDGPGRVSITDEAGETEVIETSHVVLATGSSPIQIPSLPFDGEAIIDSTGALALTELPEHMAVVGGGVIGMELGGVYARLGSKVTVIEALDRVLAVFDKDVVRPVAQKQKKTGMTHMVSTLVTGSERLDNGKVRLKYKDAKGEGNLDVDKVLVAVGRRPNTGDLGLESVGLAANDRGQIAVDAQMKTNTAGVYAIGDIVAGPMLAHKASKEGEVVAEVIAGKSSAMDVACIPNVVYTVPEIATVGPTLAELKESGRKIKIGKFSFGALGRAMTADATEGFARVIGDAESGEILAIHLVGAEVSELVNEAALSMEMAAVLDDMSLTIHAHPTLSESLMEAAKAALGEAIHTINR